jgi:hypothetical protein
MSWRGTAVKEMPLPTSISVARSLLVSKDPDAVAQITDAMQALAITTEVCGDVTTARHVLHTQKFDVVAVDFELGEDSPGLLGELRISPSNRTAPVLAITRSKSDLALAYCAGGTFLLEKTVVGRIVDTHHERWVWARGSRTPALFSASIPDPRLAAPG